MAAFLTSLAQIGSQVGDAKNSVREEKAATAEKAQRMDVEQSYLQIAKQAEARQQQEREDRLKAGHYMNVNGRLFDVVNRKWVETQQPDPADTLNTFLKTVDPKVRQRAQAAAEAVLETDPGHPKAAIAEALRIVDESHKEDQRQAEEKVKHTEHEADVSNTRQFQHQEHEDSRAFQAQMRGEQLIECKKEFAGREKAMAAVLKAAADMAAAYGEYCRKVSAALAPSYSGQAVL